MSDKEKSINKESSLPPKAKKKIELTEYTLKDDFPPKKKGEKILLSAGGVRLLKSKNLI